MTNLDNKPIPIECTTTHQIFPSMKAATKWCGVSRKRLRQACDGMRGHAGRHPDTGQLLAWRYAE